MRLQVSGNVLGCHGRPGSSCPTGDSLDSGGYLGGIEVEGIEQEVIQRLPEQGLWQGVWRKVREVVGDDDVGTACPRGGHHVSVVWVWQSDGLYERFPAGYERVGECRFHLTGEPGEVGSAFLW